MNEFELDIQDDRDRIASLEAQILDVDSTLSLLKSQDGVCRRNVVSFESQLPEELPLSSFTANPSHTNLSVTRASLENYRAGLWAMMGAAIAAMIMKLVQWFRARQKRQNAEKVLERINALTKRQAKELKDIPPLDIQVAAKKAASAYQSRFESLYTEFGNDAFRAGPFSRQVYSLQRTVLGTYLPKVINLAEVVDRLVKSPDVSISMRSEVDTAVKYLETIGKQMLRTANINERQVDLGEGPMLAIANRLDETRKELDSKTLSDNVISSVMPRVWMGDEVGKTLASESIEDRDFRFKDRNALRNVDKLETVASKIAKDSKSSTEDPEGTKLLRRLTQLIQKEVVGIQKYLSILGELSHRETEIHFLNADYYENVSKKLP